jgi:hypothetical protein
MAVTEFTNTVVHNWSVDVGSSLADYAVNYADNLLYAYVQGNSAVRTYGISTYDLATKTELSWVDMSGNFEAEMTNFDYLDAMCHIPGTDIMIAKLFKARTPPTGDEIEIVTFDITTGAIIDSTGLLNTTTSPTATLTRPVLVPVTSSATTKHYWIAPYTDTTASPYGVSKWMVVECDTSGNLTLRENNTAAPTASIGLRNTVGKQGSATTDYYFLDVDERILKKVAIPFTWVNPTATNVYDLNTLDATVRPRAVYWHEPLNYILTIFQEVNLGTTHLLALDTERSNLFKYNNEIAYFPTGFNAAMTNGGTYNLSISDTARVAVDAPLETAIPSLGYSVNAFTICVQAGSIWPIPVAYNSDPALAMVDIGNNLAIFTELSSEVLDTEVHLLSVYYDTVALTSCPLIGISFGEEKDPLYLDFGSIS